MATIFLTIDNQCKSFASVSFLNFIFKMNTFVFVTLIFPQPFKLDNLYENVSSRSQISCRSLAIPLGNLDAGQPEVLCTLGVTISNMYSAFLNSHLEGKKELLLEQYIIQELGALNIEVKLDVKSYWYFKLVCFIS